VNRKCSVGYQYKSVSRDRFYFFTSLSPFILLSFLFKIIDEVIKLVDYLFNNAPFS
jgi:hypothetical protein